MALSSLHDKLVNENGLCECNLQALPGAPLQNEHYEGHEAAIYNGLACWLDHKKHLPLPFSHIHETFKR